MKLRVAAWTTVVLFLCLLVVGSFVNSSRAALSVPDWPLSYGKLLMTSWPGNTFWEQLHRLVVAICGVALVALAIIARNRIINVALALFVVQVILGGVIVLKLNPQPVSATHVVIAQLILALLISVAPPTAAALQSIAHRKLLIATTSLLAVQILLGALSRHPSNKQQFIITLLAHVLTGLVLLILIIILAVKERRTRWLLLFVILQVAVAVPLFIIAPEPLHDEWPPPRGFREAHAAHVVLAALFLGTSARLLRYHRAQ